MALPPRWAEDPLSEFIQNSFENTLATFVRKKGAFKVLVTIDSVFRGIGENLDNPHNILVPAFLHRSHSAFLASCRLAMSGQAVDTFPPLRSCLEYALYALHIYDNPAFAEVWLRRHDDDESIRETRRLFQHRRVMESLRARDVPLHDNLSELYERTIDFGGHPNERAVSSSSVMRKEGDDAVIRNLFLHGDSLALDLALKTTAQVSLGSLMVFRLIFKERFHLLRLSDTIDALGNIL